MLLNILETYHLLYFFAHLLSNFHKKRVTLSTRTTNNSIFLECSHFWTKAVRTTVSTPQFQSNHQFKFPISFLQLLLRVTVSHIHDTWKCTQRDNKIRNNFQPLLKGDQKPDNKIVLFLHFFITSVLLFHFRECSK